jgi:hypothetical protein
MVLVTVTVSGGMSGRSFQPEPINSESFSEVLLMRLKSDCNDRSRVHTKMTARKDRRDRYVAQEVEFLVELFEDGASVKTGTTR